MAGAHAKFTGEVGVCLATSGPGAIHLLNGLYDARMDHQPVLAIVGQQAATALGSDYQQEVDLQSLFKDVSAYVETVVSPAQRSPRARRSATSSNGWGASTKGSPATWVRLCWTSASSALLPSGWPLPPMRCRLPWR